VPVRQLILFSLALPLVGCLVSPPANESCGHHLRLWLEFDGEPPADGVRIVLQDDVHPRKPYDCTPYSPWEGEPSCYDGLFDNGLLYSYHDELDEAPPEAFDLWIWETPLLQLLFNDTLSAQYEWAPLEDWDPDSMECQYGEVTVSVPGNGS